MKALVLALFALVFASVVPAASAQDVVSQVNLPDRQVGDTWQYSYRDTRRNKPGVPFSVTVTEVMADGGFAVDIGGQKFFFGKGAGGVTTAAKSLEFAFPMKIGKESYRASDDALGLHWNFNVTREVVAVEKVEVPAGTFEAFKIVFVNKYTGSAGFGAVSSGTITDTWWYAPAVENFVKRTFSDDGDRAGSGLIIRELLEYQIK